MILAIDTAGPWVALAAGDASGPIKAARHVARLNHNEMLQGLLDELSLPEPGRGFQLVAVDAGPGSFTGTRVGVAFAAGLAAGLDVRLQAVSAFEVASELAPRSEHLAVAFPIVGDSWCRARLLRKGDELVELESAEFEVADVARGLDGATLVVPWGKLNMPRTTVRDDVITPPVDWNPAVALLGAVRRKKCTGSEPAQVRVRYLGPSQAEQNYRARRDRV